MKNPVKKFPPSLLLFASLVLAVSSEGAAVVQIFRPVRLTRGDTNVRRVQDIDDAAWIWMSGEPLWGVATDCNAWDDAVPLRDAPSRFCRFRRTFASDGTPLRLDVSADERFTLYLDGEAIARGPQRGLVDHWYYQSYEIKGLAAGEHTLEAVCWQLGLHAPIAQLSYRGGFILKAEGAYDAQLTTGKADWQVAPLANTVMTDRGTSGTFGVGSQCRVVGTGFPNEMPRAENWRKAVVVRPPIAFHSCCGRAKGWMLFPADRPDQIYRRQTPGVFRAARAGSVRKPFEAGDANHPLVAAFNGLLKGRAVTVPAHTDVILAWDLDDYYCAYPELAMRGGSGASVEWGWAESAFQADPTRNNRKVKADRNAIVGKDLDFALRDTFVSDGRDDAFFTAPWWRCGRWCEIHVRTGDAPLTITRLAIGESRYPLAVDGTFACDDPSMDSILAISRRAMMSCMHEMLFDCPYYEQQMYPGDSRVQLQILNALTRDARMTRFAMSAFAYDQRPDGMVAMNFPTRGTQESSTYTMCWIMMFRDFLMWRNDAAFLKVRMPSVRRALMGLSSHENAEGFVQDLPGWSFMDWVYGPEGFQKGVAPDGDVGAGVSSLNNLQYLLALQSAAAVDAALGEHGYAEIWRNKAERLGRALVEIFWDAERGALADTKAKDRFSEHAQAMAILADILSEADAARAFQTLVTDPKLARASSYFSYYLFEAYAKRGRADLIRERFNGWRRFVDWGAKTALETQHSDSRSDCHAWSASPLYFVQTAFAGVRPSSPFFRTVRIAPQPAGLHRIRATTPCPQGRIVTDLAFDDAGGVSGTVTLPPGMTGTFVWKNRTTPLAPGRTILK